MCHVKIHVNSWFHYYIFVRKNKTAALIQKPRPDAFVYSHMKDNIRTIRLNGCLSFAHAHFFYRSISFVIL